MEIKNRGKPKMSHWKRIAGVVCAVMLVGLFLPGFGMTGGAAPRQEGGIVWEPQWDQSVINQAVSEHPMSMQIGNFAFSSKIKSAQCMYILSLMAYYNPELASTNGTKVVDRLLAHLSNLTLPGNAPSCRGSLGGWVDNPVAQAMVLAKNTPAVWDNVSKAEKEKLDFIMSVMAVTNNYCQNYQNNPCSDLSQDYWWSKGWNPNHQEGGVGNMIAAYLYFGGADKVNKILTGFSYDEYIAKMEQYGYTDMKHFYETTGKELLENGGQDTNERGEHGSVVGAKIPFTYRANAGPRAGEEIEYDPVELYSALVYAMYGKTVVSEYVDNSGSRIAYIADGSTSPFEGMEGMASEFSSGDAEGVRVSSGYVESGWRNSVPTRATLMALGYWDSGRMAQEERRMYIGSEDFLFKTDPAHGGFFDYSHGTQASKPTTQSSFFGNGFVYQKQIWDKYIKQDYTMQATVEASGSITVAFDSLSPEEERAAFLTAVYDADGRLTDVTTKEAAIANGASEFHMSAASGALIKLFRITGERGLEFVASSR